MVGPSHFQHGSHQWGFNPPMEDLLGQGRGVSTERGGGLFHSTHVIWMLFSDARNIEADAEAP